MFRVIISFTLRPVRESKLLTLLSRTPWRIAQRRSPPNLESLVERRLRKGSQCKGFLYLKATLTKKKNRTICQVCRLCRLPNPFLKRQLLSYIKRLISRIICYLRRTVIFDFDSSGKTTSSVRFRNPVGSRKTRWHNIR